MNNPNTPRGSLSRRQFLGRASSLAAGGHAAPFRTSRKVLGANSRIVMGIMGCGDMITGDMNALTGTGVVEYAGTCDI